MKIVIELQEAFSGHYAEDKFEDSLQRIRSDVHYLYEEGDEGDSLSGNYELELLDELLRAFQNSYQETLEGGENNEENN